MDDAPAPPACAPPPAGDPDAVCPRCGSEQLVLRKAKLVCERCHTIVMTCCEF